MYVNVESDLALSVLMRLTIMDHIKLELSHMHRATVLLDLTNFRPGDSLEDPVTATEMRVAVPHPGEVIGHAWCVQELNQCVLFC
jgi:hypothetical protein